jgi:putative FmdB family regulatory protein
MPTYAYRCRACAQTFELQRSMSESDALATCPDGHDDTVKLLSTVSLTGSPIAGSAMDAPSGGGCCGGGCCG